MIFLQMEGNNTHQFTGIPVSEGVQVTVVLLGCLVALNDVFGNTFIIITVVFQKSLHSLHNIYIANLAVADLMVTGYVVPFWVTDLCLGHHPVINDTHCQVNGFLVMICFVVSIYTLVLISFNRYLGVCRHEVFVKLFTQKTVVSSCVVLWILTIAVFVLPFFHISHSAYTYSHKARLCLYDAANLTSLYSVVSFVNVILPTVLVGVFSFSILKFWKASKSKVEHWGFTGNDSHKPSRRPKISSADIALIRSLVLVFVILILLYCPLVLTDIIDKSVVNVSGDVFAFGVLLLFVNHSINWILYGILNKNFKRAYKQQITQCFRSKKLRMQTTRTATRAEPSSDV